MSTDVRGSSDTEKKRREEERDREGRMGGEREREKIRRSYIIFFLARGAKQHITRHLRIG